MHEMNKTCWKPYIDYEALAVGAGEKVCFFGGRKDGEVASYNAKENKWGYEKELEMAGIKPFGSTTGTMISKNEVIFFGGVQYAMQTLSIPINFVQRVNLETKQSKLIEYDPLIVPPRFYHAQCHYGDYLIVSVRFFL